ncbi:hypothetical protein F5B20DRAFT_238768 [Whalleya microplaca]|nr:hypothetical protein F5B20DRAFT_238768 [Whalleya microplaca]
MAHHGSPRPNGYISGSDTSSQYSDESIDSWSSVWSSSPSEAFVYRDDPYGWDGIQGAVTRHADDRDDWRKRFAAHILSGPFAQRRNGRRSRRRSTGSRGSPPPIGIVGGLGGRPPFQPQPPPPPQFHQQRPPSAQSYGEQFIHDEFQGHGPPPPPPMHHNMGPPPPPPQGFDAGFIQLGGQQGGGPMPPQPPPDPYWGHQQPGGQTEFYD